MGSGEEGKWCPTRNIKASEKYQDVVKYLKETLMLSALYHTV